MATVYYPQGIRVELQREGVERYRAVRSRDAERLALRKPTKAEWEAGLDTADLRAECQAAVREVERLTKVLAAIDAGLPELPADLYP